MAVVQRKLVHKQFNSPIGLYSEQNVKETLNRELKAFGTDGIEIDEQITKPLNLTNSAVLRAVEEEDQQIKCGFAIRRQSRPRQRFYHHHHAPLHQQQLEQIKTQYLTHQHDVNIDRDTVLKINRLATRRNLHKRDHSWPPPQPSRRNGENSENGENGENDNKMDRHGLHARSSSNDNAIHFDMGVCKRHEIDALREKFNSPTRVIEPTAAEVRQHRKITQQQNQHLRQQKPKSVVHKMTSNKSTNGFNQTGRQEHHNAVASTSTSTTASASADVTETVPMTNVVNNKAHTSSTKLSTRTKPPDEKSKPSEYETGIECADGHHSMPNRSAVNETIVDTNVNVDDIGASRTPTFKGFSAPETRAADENIGLVEPKCQYYEQLAARRWHSIDNIISHEQSRQSMIPLRPDVAGTPMTINNNRRQSYSLDRGRARQERSQQLPPLKPRTSSISGSGTDGSITSFGRTSKSPKHQRRSIKLATEIKICYDTDAQPIDEILNKNKADAKRQSDSHICKIAQIGQMTTAANSPVIQSTTARVTENQQLNKSICAHEFSMASIADLEHIPLPPTPIEVATKPTSLTVAVTTVAGENQQLADNSTNDQRRIIENAVTIPTTMTAGKAIQQCKIHIMKDVDDTTSKTEQQLLHHSYKGAHNWNKASTPSSRIIPVTVEKRNDVDESCAKISDIQRDLIKLNAQQIYDEACIYLRSIDLQDNTVAFIPAAITIVPSPTEEVVKHWAEPVNLKANIELKSNACSSHQIMSSPPPVPPPPPPPPPPIPPNLSYIKSGTKKDLQHPAPNNPANSDKTSSALAAEMPIYLTRLPAGTACGGIQLSRQRSLPGKTPNTSQTVDEIIPLDSVGGTRMSNAYTQDSSISIPDTSGMSTLLIRDRTNKSSEPEKVQRRRGIYYTDGEHLFGPFHSEDLDPWHVHVVPIEPTDTKPNAEATEPTPSSTIPTVKESKPDFTTTAEKCKHENDKSSKTTALNRMHRAQTNQSEIAPLEAKYGEIQQSISEHLRQIETYMQNAKLALSRTLQQNPFDATMDVTELSLLSSTSQEAGDVSTASQSPHLIIETPLQIVLRQIKQQQQQESTQCSRSCSNSIKDTILSNATAAHISTENMPVVEQALLDLSNITEKITNIQSKQLDDSNGMKRILRQLVDFESPTRFEMIKLEHTFAPSADLPTHVTIDDEDGELNTSDCLPTPLRDQLGNDTNKSQNECNQKAVELANISEDKQSSVQQRTDSGGHNIENVANNEQLSSISSVAPSHVEKLNIVPKHDMILSTPSPSSGVIVEPVTSVISSSVESAAERQKLSEYKCKNLNSAFIEQRQDQKHTFGQVIGVFDARSNQQQLAASSLASISTTDSTAAASASAATGATNFHAQQTEKSQQQSSSCKENDEAMITALPQPQEHITSTLDNAESIIPKNSKTTTTKKVSPHDETNTSKQHFTVDDNDKKSNKKQEEEATGLLSLNAINSHHEIDKKISSGTSAENDNHLPHCQDHAAHISRDDNEGFTTAIAAAAAAASCLTCGIKSTWGKMTFADQWRVENLRKTPADDIFDTYKATYEIPSPYVSRQISWDDTLEFPTTQKSQVQITHEIATETDGQTMIATVANEPTKTDNEMQSPNRARTSLHWVHSKSAAAEASAVAKNNTEQYISTDIATTKVVTSMPAPTSTPLSAAVVSQSNEVIPHPTSLRAITPTRKYPAPLIEPDIHKRAASPFGLNVVEIPLSNTNSSNECSQHFSHLSSSPPSPPPLPPLSLIHDSKYAYVPQVEGHNIGLLVRTIAEPSSSTIREQSDSPTSWYRATSKTGFHTNTPTTLNSETVKNKTDDVELHRLNSIVTSSKTVSGIEYAYTGSRTTPASSTMHEHTRAHNQKSTAGSTEWTTYGNSNSDNLQSSLFEYSTQIGAAKATAAGAGTTFTASTSSSSSKMPTTSNITSTISPASVNTRDQSSSPYNLGYFSIVPSLDKRAYIENSTYMDAYGKSQIQPTNSTLFSSNLNTNICELGSANAINRSFHNVSPRPYITIEGYKRVAWPPISEERIVREFTPQPQPQQDHQLHQPTQDLIHNKTKPGGRQSSPYPSRYRQQYQQESQRYQQNQVPPQEQEHQQHHHDQQDQPIQHTQAQFNRQSSREPVQYQPQYQPIEQHNCHQHEQPQGQYQAKKQHQQNVIHHRIETNSPISAWKPIRPPTAKPQQQYSSRGSSAMSVERNYSTYVPSMQFQHQQQHQHQQQQQEQQHHHYQRSTQQPTPYHQQHPVYSQDQPDFQHHQQQQQYQHAPQNYRGASPGIITLRKETPVSQKPAPVFTSQPAAVSFQGGSNMRGDLKWPPPEYKEAAARENEERRKIAMGPVCRPRRVNRDYTNFFAKNALSHYYPSYKVPPGTQHIYE